VEFQYEIGSKTHTASGPGFGETGRSSLSRAEVEVRYNPAKPAEAFLEFGGTPAWIMLGVGLRILAVAVVRPGG
jgi:hypothetical protein